MRISILVLICCGLFACDQPQQKNRMSSSYFDLESYFEAEIHRLSKMKTPVTKKVSRNGTDEIRHVKPDWENELALFAESDINKPAWKNSYRSVSTPNRLQYIALEDNLKTRKIDISRTGNQIKRIHIINKTSNFLYNSTENLLYQPDSLYIIVKEQQVKILGKNEYVVTGRFE